MGNKAKRLLEEAHSQGFSLEEVAIGIEKAVGTIRNARTPSAPDGELTSELEKWMKKSIAERQEDIQAKKGVTAYSQLAHELGALQEGDEFCVYTGEFPRSLNDPALQVACLKAAWKGAWIKFCFMPSWRLHEEFAERGLPIPLAIKELFPRDIAYEYLKLMRTLRNLAVEHAAEITKGQEAQYPWHSYELSDQHRDDVMSFRAECDNNGPLSEKATRLLARLAVHVSFEAMGRLIMFLPHANIVLKHHSKTRASESRLEVLRREAQIGDAASNSPVFNRVDYPITLEQFSTIRKLPNRVRIPWDWSKQCGAHIARIEALPANDPKLWDYLSDFKQRAIKHQVDSHRIPTLTKWAEALSKDIEHRYQFTLLCAKGVPKDRFSDLEAPTPSDELILDIAAPVEPHPRMPTHPR